MLGNLIAEARKKKGWTQKDLADRIGTSSSYISMIESEEKIPNDLTLDLLADKLGLGKERLHGLAEDKRLDNEVIKLKQRHAAIAEKRGEYNPEELPGNLQSLIKKHPEITEALNDPVALKVFLAVHKTSSDVKETCKIILDSLPSMPDKKRKAILTLIEGIE
ncbi:MAG: helix-turn-helix domain-containing protein [Candidatus Omnitrophica bacterium]|nr:helix-turn-helix domain-containing protein [Candidatus Omnitrophota bacterium]